MSDKRGSERIWKILSLCIVTVLAFHVIVGPNLYGDSRKLGSGTSAASSTAKAVQPGLESSSEPAPEHRSNGNRN